MENIKIGDRVVDKITLKHGVVDSFIRPWSFGHTANVKARIKLDNGCIADQEIHNLKLEEGYVPEKVDNVGINALDNPNDKAESLTPMKKRGRKKKDNDEVIDDIVDATV